MAVSGTKLVGLLGCNLMRSVAGDFQCFRFRRALGSLRSLMRWSAPCRGLRSNPCCWRCRAPCPRPRTSTSSSAGAALSFGSTHVSATRAEGRVVGFRLRRAASTKTSERVVAVKSVASSLRDARALLAQATATKHTHMSISSTYSPCDVQVTWLFFGEVPNDAGAARKK